MELGDILVLELQASLPKNKQQQEYQTKQKTQHYKSTILQYFFLREQKSK